MSIDAERPGDRMSFYNPQETGAPKLTVRGRPDQRRSTSVHELQHAVDDIEGSLGPNIPYETPAQAYRSLSEVTARNVQWRLEMNAAERRAKAPWLTQDVPDENQIVRGSGKGPQMMASEPTIKPRIRGSSENPRRPRSETEHLAYHGTKSEAYDKFDPEFSNDGFFWLAPDPKIANNYAMTGARSFDTPHVIPAYVDTEGFLVKDFSHIPVDPVYGNWSEVNLEARRLAEEGKHKGLIAHNVVDATEDGANGAPQTNYVTWTPKTVRNALSDNQLFSGAPLDQISTQDIIRALRMQNVPDEQQIVRNR